MHACIDFTHLAAGAAAPFPLSQEVELLVLQDGVVNCVSWWWVAHLDATQTISNRPLAVGGHNRTHWMQPLLPVGPIPVRAGDRLKVKLSIDDAAGQKMTFDVRPASKSGASAWACADNRLPTEPLQHFLSTWPRRVDEACELQNGVINKYLGKGEVEKLACVQRAVLALVACPALFSIGSHIQDRLLASFFGMSA
eukprot:1715419-Amphidinium_carterae.1